MKNVKKNLVGKIDQVLTFQGILNFLCSSFFSQNVYSLISGPSTQQPPTAKKSDEPQQPTTTTLTKTQSANLSAQSILADLKEIFLMSKTIKYSIPIKIDNY